MLLRKIQVLLNQIQNKYGEREEERKMVSIKKARALCGDFSEGKTNATAPNIKVWQSICKKNYQN